MRWSKTRQLVECWCSSLEMGLFKVNHQHAEFKCFVWSMVTFTRCDVHFLLLNQNGDTPSSSSLYLGFFVDLFYFFSPFNFAISYELTGFRLCCRFHSSWVTVITSLSSRSSFLGCQISIFKPKRKSSNRFVCIFFLFLIHAFEIGNSRENVACPRIPLTHRGLWSNSGMVSFWRFFRRGGSSKEERRREEREKIGRNRKKLHPIENWTSILYFHSSNKYDLSDTHAETQ